MKMRRHRIKGVEYRYRHNIIRIVAGNGYHRKTFDWENY